MYLEEELRNGVEGGVPDRGNSSLQNLEEVIAE